nr:hypothetical protein CFP56_56353 [Quercus suber]
MTRGIQSAIILTDPEALLNMEECKAWEVAAIRDQDIVNTLTSLVGLELPPVFSLFPSRNKHKKQFPLYKGILRPALGHMSKDSELPRKSLTRLFRLVAEPVFEIPYVYIEAQLSILFHREEVELLGMVLME